ncbi:MAG: DUF2259 domain-containing protein [Pyrinomonadaceae bacterium]|nr:DUF2259 domain-containing protein [Pyrinomonadaceae bacterium]
MNKNMFRLLVILFVLPMFFSTARAGDSNNLNIIGFSKDGKYLAFEEYGSHDGSGFAYSYYTFVNVEKNTFAAPRYVLEAKDENSTEAAIRRKAKLANFKKMQEFKIIAGNKGTLVVSRLLTDLTMNGDNEEGASDRARFTEQIYYVGRRGDYELAVKQIKTETADCKVYERSTYKTEISLLNNETQTTKMLQKDDVLPKSRGCVTNYRIQDIYIYEDKIISFLNIRSPGFEGDNMSYMVVTGKLK